MSANIATLDSITKSEEFHVETVDSNELDDTQEDGHTDNLAEV